MVGAVDPIPEKDRATAFPRRVDHTALRAVLNGSRSKFEVGDLPPPPRNRGRAAIEGQDSDDASPAADPQLTEAAALLELVLAPGDLDNIEPDQLSEGDFRFYAAVWEEGDNGKPVAFVDKYDPTNVLRKASHWFRFDGALRSTDPPDFTLDERADLVITTDEVATLNLLTFDRLFSDIRALLNNVPSNVVALRAALISMPMTDASAAAIEEVCGRLPSLARRLQNLAGSPAAAAVDANVLRAVLSKHGQRPGQFVKRGQLDIDASQVSVLLDVTEGRWYEADFTSEPRRAARWSRR